MINSFLRFFPQSLLKESLKGDRFYTVLDQGLLSIYGFIYIIMIVRPLTKFELGYLVLADSVKFFIAALADGCWGQALIKYIAGAEEDEQGTVLATGVLVKILALFACFVVVWIISDPLSKLLNSPPLKVLLRLLPAVVGAKMVYTTGRTVLVARREFRRLFLVHFLYAVVFLSAILLSRWLFGLERALEVILVFLTANLLGSLATFWFLKGRWKLGAYSREWRIKIVKFAKAAFINTTGSWLYWKTDVLMLGGFRGPEAAAIYGIAGHFTKLFTLLLEAFHLVIFPSVSAITKNKPALSHQNMIKIKRLYLRAGFILQLLIAFASIVLFIFAQQFIVFLFSDRYLDSVPVLRILLVGLLMTPFARLGGSVLNGMGYPHICAVITWITGCVNVMLNLILIPQLGLNGAAISSAISMGVMLIMYIWMVAKKTRLQNRDFNSSQEHIL